jgi:SAM-dependent methyltransferase
MKAWSYEARTNYNSIVRWLHSHRYRYVRDAVGELASRLNRTIRVLDVGCGYGRVVDELAGLPVHITGFDRDREMVTGAAAKYPAAKFIVGEGADPNMYQGDFDVVVAMETLEHAVPAEVPVILDLIANERPELFICSVPVEVGPIVWIKNGGSALMGYWRGDEYRPSYTFWAGLYQLHKIPPHNQGHMGFDWRNLEKQIRERFQILHRYNLPLRQLPLATNVLWMSKPL